MISYLLVNLFSLLLDHLLYNADEAFLFIHDLEVQIIDEIPHEVCRALPDLLLTWIVNFDEHDESIVSFKFGPFHLIHEIAKLVILHDQFAFVLIQHKFGCGHLLFVAVLNQSNEDAHDNNVKKESLYHKL